MVAEVRESVLPEMVLVTACCRRREELPLPVKVSTATVRLHVSNVLMKLHAPNRTTAAVIAVENLLV